MGVHNWHGLTAVEYAKKRIKDSQDIEDIQRTESKLLRNYEKSLIRRSEIDPREPK